MRYDSRKTNQSQGAPRLDFGPITGQSAAPGQSLHRFGHGGVNIINSKRDETHRYTRQKMFRVFGHNFIAGHLFGPMPL